MLLLPAGMKIMPLWLWQKGLISLLDRDEIAGVIGHELSHIRHHDTLIMTLAATFATAISYLAQAAQWAAIFGSGRDSEGRSNNPFALIATIIIAPLAASLVQMALSRSREFMADASGAEISGKAFSACPCITEIGQLFTSKSYALCKTGFLRIIYYQSACGCWRLCNIVF